MNPIAEEHKPKIIEIVNRVKFNDNFEPEEVKEIKGKIVKNILDGNTSVVFKTVKSLEEFAEDSRTPTMMDTFSWSDSNEGLKYWMNLYDRNSTSEYTEN